MAEALPGEFADGVQIVDLAPITDPDLVVPTIAESLGIIDAGDQSPFASLKQRLWDKRFLLVLDVPGHGERYQVSGDGRQE